MKEFEDFIAHRKTRWIAGILGVLIVALLIFHAGVVVGSHRQSLGGPFVRENALHGFRPLFVPRGFALPHGFMSGVHGAVGTITAVSASVPPVLTLQTREETDETILLGTSTEIRNANGMAENSISPGEQVIVIGRPDGEDRMEARIIRILSIATSTP